MELKNKTILVIDDDERIRDLVVAYLEGEGYRVLQTANGHEGIETAHQELPDLIICDVNMPEVDGYQVLSELQSDQQTRLIPFVFLTANDQRNDVRRGMESGADDYLTKPFTSEELLNMVEILLTKRRMLNEHSQGRMGELRQSIARALPHEVRTPLTMIYGYSSLLLEETARLDPELASMVTAISQGAGRLYELSERFLLYTEIELLAADPLQIVRQSVNCPHELLAQIAQEAANSAGRGKDLILNLEHSSLALEKLHLTILVRELMNNACKFSTTGTPIEICSSVVKYMISVTDHGCGMTDQQIANIDAYMQFDRDFYEQQGVGLGLALVKRIAELYGGQLEIRSQPGEYTTVFASVSAVVSTDD